MKVKELIEFLQTVDPDLEVWISYDEGSSASKEAKLSSRMRKDDTVEIEGC